MLFKKKNSNVHLSPVNYRVCWLTITVALLFKQFVFVDQRNNIGIVMNVFTITITTGRDILNLKSFYTYMTFSCATITASKLRGEPPEPYRRSALGTRTPLSRFFALITPNVLSLSHRSTNALHTIFRPN